MASLTETFAEIKNDLPQLTLKKFIKAFFFNSAFRVLLNYRIGKYFYFRKNRFAAFIAKRYKYILITKRGCDISYKAKIGKNLRLPHPNGIIIGDGVVIKDNVKIWHQVTLGSHGRQGQLLEYPIIEDGVKIFAGAKIIGGVTVGKNAVVGANSVVNIPVPERSTAVGIPCKIIQ